MLRLTVVGLCFTMLGAAVPVVQAQNLLINPNFGGGTIAPWLPGATSATYDGTRSATADGTGSAAGTYTQAANTSGIANNMTQCVTTFQPGKQYNFGGKIYLPSGQAATGYSLFTIQFYTANDCATGFIISPEPSTGTVATSSPTNTWIPVQGTVVAPVAGSARFIVGIGNNNSTNAPDTLQFNFDELFFQAAPAPIPAPVPTLGAAWLFGLAVVLSLAALFVGSRKTG